MGPLFLAVLYNHGTYKASDICSMGEYPPFYFLLSNTNAAFHSAFPHITICYAMNVTSHVPAVMPNLAPISKLPAELVLEMFHIASRTPNFPAVQPVIFSQVCRSWRRVAQGTSTLWDYILVIEDLGTDTLEFDKTLRRVHHYLELSRKCPLHIDISLFSSCRYMDELNPENSPHANLDVYRERIGQLSSLIGLHAARFKSFAVESDEFCNIVNVQSAIPHVPMPLLEVWRATYDCAFQALSDNLNEPDDSKALSILLCPKDMPAEEFEFMYPSLTKVSLIGVPLDWPRFRPTNLKELTISDLPLDGRPSGPVLRQILLGNVQSLRSLTLFGVNGEPTPSYELPNVLHLELGFTSPELMISFLETAQFPNLKLFGFTDIWANATDPGSRRFIPDRHSYQRLLETVIDRLPLHRLHQAYLRNLAFSPLPRWFHSHPTSELVSNALGKSIKKQAMDFFSSLSSLQYLLLVGPDQMTLDTINYVPPLDATDKRVPIPATAFFHIADPDYPLLQDFLKTRDNHASCFRPFLRNIISLPADNTDAVVWPTLLNESLFGRSFEVQKADINTDYELALAQIGYCI